MICKVTGTERPSIGVATRFHIKKGDQVLIVTVPDQDKYVAEAVKQAILESGAEKVDFIYPQDLVGKDPQHYSVADGWREAELLEEGKASGTATDLLTGLGLGEAAGRYLDEHPEYTIVFLDVAGGNAKRALGKHAEKFGGYFPFNNWEWFLSRAHTFPLELWQAIEKKLVEPLGKAADVRITDPEGTHLEFSLTPEEAKRWEGYAMLHGHLIFSPLHATSGEYREHRPGTLDAPMVFPKVTGVLAGTSNHCGFFPRIETYFDQDRLVDVRGGGEYGDRIRKILDKNKDIQWPGYPERGYFWFCDTALCTSVGAFRRTSDMFDSLWIYPNLLERTRAGVFHLGFGSRASRGEEEFDAYAKEHNLPRGHIHVHNYFATFEVRIQGSRNWYKIVDKGWISAMSDPDIRAIAAKYGLPDKLLSYDWVPPLPGINCDGDYLKDYAPNPMAYLKSRLEKSQTI